MTPIVFIPGMMCDARIYQHQIAVISSHPTLFATINEHDSIPKLAADILSYSPPSFCLCGLSMGGIVAMEILRQAAHRVERLCLMDTNAKAETEIKKRQRQPQIQRVLKGNLEQVMREEIKPNYLFDQEKRQDILDLCISMSLNLGAKVFERQSIALRDRPDYQSTLQTFDKPTLILHGDHDTLCPAENHQLIHQLMPNSIYKTIPHAGHLPTLENPTKVNVHLMLWMSL